MCQFVVVFFCLASLSNFAAAADQFKPAKAFERLRALTGMWHSRPVNGDQMKTEFRVTAGGSVVMGRSGAGTPTEMITMYYLDGERLMLTHFCGDAKNQPRMVAKGSADLKTVAFDFLDATNLPSPQVGHMHSVVFTFIDSDHYTEQWTWQEAGKQTKYSFEMARVGK